MPLLSVRNPATGSLIAQVRPAGPQEYESVISSAVATAAAWRAVPAPKRGEVVRLIGEELRRAKADLGTLVSLENGKILAEGLGEVQEMIDIADFAVGQSRMLYGLTMHSERPGHRMYEQWHPLGVVGILSAFNFPVAVWSWNAFLAAICGNVSVWKPSPKTPLTAIAVQQLCNRVLSERGLPPIFQLFIDGGTELATRFVDDRRVALISFTGSTPVGRKVGERVAARLGKSLLELGGNNAIIVDETANLDLAVPAIVFGAVGTAGQRCTSYPPRLRPQSRSRGARASPDERLPPGPHRQPHRSLDPDGPPDRRPSRRALPVRRSRRPRRRRRSPLRRQHHHRPRQLRRAHPDPRPQRLSDRPGRNLRPHPLPDPRGLPRGSDRSSRTPPPTASPPPSSPTACSTPRLSSPPPAATAA